MINLKINHAKNFIPQNIAKGTTAQRLQKARHFNLKFYDNLQEMIINNVVAPRTFVQTLNRVTGSKIQADIYCSEKSNEGDLKYCFDMNGKSKGYVITIPFASFLERIHKNSALTFLKVTQELFNEALNPKFLQRYITMVKKGYNVKKAIDFYSENISGTNKLETNVLNSFLDNKKEKEQIETLQFLRYKLLSEKNTAQALKQIEKRIERYNDLNYIRSADYFDLGKYNYDEKFSIIESKLAELIRAKRELIKKGL